MSTDLNLGNDQHESRVQRVNLKLFIFYFSDKDNKPKPTGTFTLTPVFRIKKKSCRNVILKYCDQTKLNHTAHKMTTCFYTNLNL